MIFGTRLNKHFVKRIHSNRISVTIGTEKWYLFLVSENILFLFTKLVTREEKLLSFCHCPCYSDKILHGKNLEGDFITSLSRPTVTYFLLLKVWNISLELNET